VNKDLYNSSQGQIEFPQDMRDHIKLCFARVVDNVNDLDKHIEGYKRNQELQNKEYIDYKVLKRIKNFFDNFKGNQKHPSFILNGSVKMKNWVDNELRRMREFGELTKRNKSETGMQNAFIAPHEKNNLPNVRPSQEHSKTVDKYNERVTESLKRINKILSKI